jgi:D-alanyl-D-alanine carboxypeptidase
MSGRHRRAVVRRRRVVAGAVLAGVAGGVLLWRAGRSPIAVPDDPCASPPAMRTLDGVTLQPAALAAFRAAEQQAGRRIPVVWSYRSCAQQRASCRDICGDPNGCANRCAPPGKSWHQLGAAIDTTQHAIDTPSIVHALLDNGWCEPLPGSDPGHFSFGGCH